MRSDSRRADGDQGRFFERGPECYTWRGRIRRWVSDHREEVIAWPIVGIVLAAIVYILIEAIIEYEYLMPVAF